MSLVVRLHPGVLSEGSPQWCGNRLEPGDGVLTHGGSTPHPSAHVCGYIYLHTRATARLCVTSSLLLVTETKDDWKRRMGVGERQVRYGRHAGTSRIEVVRRDDNGRKAGTQTHHWDGRVDATIVPPTITRNLTTGAVS